MERSRPRRGSPAAQARVRTVPIAVTPEGFWCCPSPAALHKSLKNPHHHHAAAGSNKQAPQQPHKTPSAPPSKAPSVQTAPSVTDEPPAPADEQQQHQQNQVAAEAPAPAQSGGQQEPPHKICVGFGRPETSDLTVMLYGKEGIAVRMGVHRDVLCRSSAFFTARLAGGHGPPPPCVEIHDCEKEHECLRWMDAQPDRSVVFLCFGSMGMLPKHQLAEIAAGLESSGQRFL